CALPTYPANLAQEPRIDPVGRHPGGCGHRQGRARTQHLHRQSDSPVVFSVREGVIRMHIKHICTAALATLAASALAIAEPKPAGGTVNGKVTYEGTPAKMKPIDMSKEPACAKMYATPPLAETVVTGSGNSFENVVVYISAGAPDDPAALTAAVFTD